MEQKGLERDSPRPIFTVVLQLGYFHSKALKTVLPSAATS